MPINENNVTMEMWNKAQKLVCPHLRYICGVWLAINENPCGKHERCKPCYQSSSEKIIIIKNNG